MQVLLAESWLIFDQSQDALDAFEVFGSIDCQSQLFNVERL